MTTACNPGTPAAFQSRNFGIDCLPISVLKSSPGSQSLILTIRCALGNVDVQYRLGSQWEAIEGAHTSRHQPSTVWVNDIVATAKQNPRRCVEFPVNCTGRKLI